ncbi:ankyrin 3 [Fusarium acutatum]|uniref:Ankyrin 3 n=1 Tax=Fusarium acutatum TaxID=78861 RepID=A0A8H4JMJ1_9HYPO|nr:ankyrin 3 [Fusarium acutatum]
MGSDQYIAAGGPSIQKRRPDEPDLRSKKQLQEIGKMRSYDSDDRSRSDGEARGRDNSDGQRFPQREDTRRTIFPCPFQESDPVRYEKCFSFQPSHIPGVMQHIRMQHVLKKVPITSSHYFRPDFSNYFSTFYCSRCRCEFHGLDAQKRLTRHMEALTCKPSNVQQTGVFLPEEFGDLESSVDSASGSTEMWDVIWQTCFPGSTISSPSVTMGVPRSEAEKVLKELLGSSAGLPRSSEENRQFAINRALNTIYLGPLSTATESQTKDSAALLPTKNTTVSTYSPSTFNNPDNTSSGFRKSSVDLHSISQLTTPLKTAIFNVDHDKVHAILKNSFKEVAIDEYSWLLELKALGLSTDEIADEMLERSQHGPWIFGKVNVPHVETYHRDFHIPRCLHSRKEDEAMPKVSLDQSKALLSLEGDSQSSVRETVEYLCGIGGVRPMPDGSHSPDLGFVLFEDASSTAIVSLMNIKSVLVGVLELLKQAMGALQQVGGCCDSFTYLVRRESLVELHRTDPVKINSTDSLVSLGGSTVGLTGLDLPLLESFTAQLFSLALALYAQGHCEPFRPFFLDTPLKRILLIGNQIWGPSFTGPCILASPVELSCFGEMVQRRVFAFQFFERFERSKVFLDSDKKFDLKAYPEDLLDTWGPGDFIVPQDDADNLHAISIGGGLITPNSTEKRQLPVLHWSRVKEGDATFSSTFPRNKKMVIGSRVSINQDCRMTPQDQVRMAVPWLKELGTFPSYWEVSERQLGLGLQAGQSAVGIVNFAQTWVKRLGQTKKSSILAKRSLSIADLEGPFAVQVSFCTGIARRVRLRELLADILPAYVADLATTPCYWQRLQDCDILGILRDDNFRTDYQRLDHDLQAEFETLAIAVLFLLQDTGVDRKGEKFVIGCFPPRVAIQCFKIPIEKESFWARILADSEDVATFAYVATRCFETDLVRCRGPNEQWMNTTALFSTAVSLCQDPMQGRIAQQQASWTLRDSETYLIGRVDAPLLVRVIRPNIQDEPELLVSMSTIIAPFLRRWSRKQGYKRPWRLRESRAIDHQHQLAERVVVTADFETSL